MKKYRTLELSTLVAFVAFGGAQAWAQQAQTSSIYSVAVTAGVASVKEKTGVPGNTPVLVNDNLAGMTYVGGNFGLTGGPVATAFHTLTGRELLGSTRLPQTNPQAADFMSYDTATSPTFAQTYLAQLIPAKLQGGSYSGLVYAASDYGFTTSLEAYTIHHGTATDLTPTDYWAAIIPSTDTGTAITDFKPMSWPGGAGASGGAAGRTGYFALSQADDISGAGSYALLAFFYLRTETASEANPGHIMFGQFVPALGSASADTLDLTTAVGSFGVGGYTTLAYYQGTVAAYPANQFYYLRTDSTGTGNTILGRLNPSTAAGVRTISDIANLGGTFNTLTYVPTATFSGADINRFYTTGPGVPVSGARSVSFAAIDNQQVGVAFVVNPLATLFDGSTGGAITLTVVSGAATITGAGPFTVTPTTPGIVTLRATAGGGAVPANWLQQSFNAFGTTLVIPINALTLNIAAVPFAPVTAAGATGTVNFSITGPNALPAGLTLAPLTGVISGTPLATSIATDYTVTATDGATALTSSKIFSLEVTNKTTPTITWATPGAITYGTALSATQLNATASVAGAFAYTPATGVFPVGTQTLNVVFTPTDTSLYNVTAGSVTLTINKAPLTVTAASQSRAFGVANPTLTTTISGFTNGEILATSGVAGTVGVSTTAILTSPVGAYPITPTVGSLTASNYAFTTFTAGTLTVGQTTQTITFGALGAKTFGNAPFAVSATASSGLTVSFSIVSGPATISGSTVTITGGGTVIVRASQVGDANYSAATPVDQSFTVGQTTQTITFGALGAKTFGDAPFAVSATASSGLTVSFSIVSGPATISGSTVTINGGGTVTVRASQVGNANYSAATPVDQSFTVGKAAATVTLGNLSQFFTGTAKSATATTSPSGLTVTLTYNGSATVPTAVGSYAVIGTISDNSYSGSGSGTLTISTALPGITSAITAPGTVGAPFGPYQIVATSSPTSFAASGLPAGLTVNTLTGAISGTPTTAGVSVAPISATNSSGSGTATLTITVAAAGVAPIITSATTTSGAIGTVFGPYQIEATGLPTSFSASGLPAGLTVNTLTGAISGTPTTAGVSGATIKATNSAGTGSAALTITVVAASGSPIITSATTASGTVGRPFVTYQIMATGNPTSYDATNLPPGLGVNSLTGRITGTPVSTGNYHVSLYATTATGVATASGIFTIAPSIAVQPVANTAVASGTGATFSVAANTGGNNVTYQWQKDGVNLPGATGATLTVGNVQSGNVGFYTVVVSSFGTSTTSVPAQLGMTFTGQIAGSATLAGAGIVHPNGNIYDQVLLTGKSASVKANAGQIVRVSFVDLTNDIVQVELGGAGTLTVNLENSSGPAAPANYNQPGILYMKGQASIAITGADATTNVSVFSVGRGNAVDQTLFVTGVTYDGYADIALITIASADGNFGGVRTANASYFRANGMTGIYAPGVQFSGPVWASDIDAANSANAVLVLGSVADARITGGDLFQDNSGGVEVSGMTRLQFTAGTSSGGALLPAQANRGVLMTNGVNVTSQLVSP